MHVLLRELVRKSQKDIVDVCSQVAKLGMLQNLQGKRSSAANERQSTGCKRSAEHRGPMPVQAHLMLVLTVEKRVFLALVVAQA